MTVDWIVANWLFFGPILGGLIAGLVGLVTTVFDQRKRRERQQKQWYMTVFRLVEELNTSIRTVGFMELGTDQQRLIQQFEQIADELDKQRYNAPADADQNLVSRMHNCAMNARRLHFDVTDLRLQNYHVKMLWYAEEIQYALQQEFGEELPSRFDDETMSEVEDRIETRKEMSRGDWRSEELQRIVNSLNKQRERLQNRRTEERKGMFDPPFEKGDTDGSDSGENEEDGMNLERG